MVEPASFRIRCEGKGEIEFEGTQDFVLEMLERFSEVVQGMEGELSQQGSPSRSEVDLQETSRDRDLGGSAKGRGEPPVPAEFGEYLHRFSNEVSDVDRVLIAGRYLQQQDEDHGFTTRGANELLQNQGIKVTNPSECVRRNLAAKRVFSLTGGKKFRVSQTGLDRLAALAVREHA